ncbi:terminase [uncultured Alistipes sp.]|uniref:terminase n=1 Tax=uncultured Alistipes sp. TaxID=538949 RepID=UPI00272AE499|nr:terminase [uncultured Alistipes sp.]
MANKVSEDKKEFARVLYMSGEQQNIIAEKVGVSKQTVNRWVAEGSWDKLRAAKNVTRPELINKVLRTIDKLLEKVLESEDDKDFDGLGDKLAKLAAVIEKFDKKANVVDAIEVFLAVSKWLQRRAQTDEELTPELLKAINRYQDLYVSELLSTKGE